MRSPFSLAIAGVVLLLSCDTAPGPDAALAAAIESIEEHNRAVERALSSSDLNALMAEIAEDAVWMPPNEGPLVGKEAIRTFHERLFSQVDLEGRLDPTNLTVWRFVSPLTPGDSLPTSSTKGASGTDSCCR